MRNRFLYLLLLPLLCCTSCLEILEELQLKSDGSGTYLIQTDMSQIIAMRDLFGMMGEEMQGLDTLNMEIDSVQTFEALMSKAAFGKLERPEIFQRATMHQAISTSKAKAIITYRLDFRDMYEVNYFRKHLNDALASQTAVQDANPGADMMSGGGGGFLPAVNQLFTVSRKKLQRAPMAAVSTFSAGDSEELAMVKMMLTDATYVTRYVFPGAIKSTTIAGAAIDGAVLTVEAPLIEVLDGNAELGGEVKFRR